MLYRCDSFAIVVLLTLEFASLRKLNLDRCCVILRNIIIRRTSVFRENWFYQELMQ
ncbi:hypothetical protein M758_12G111300 [Ceratodon purpureus]|uniref:Uncharacterized protein n=1 Tax=Ceratodon purpureus TaxID=3225 RepID=A0A8T0G856_CERPU|nr:hypothetical protein KC19_12G107300 [Ceratodon purpureus]KAG0598910.1 hypothetical protein M758_12G111300 [Ceratodon purpureus]